MTFRISAPAPTAKGAAAKARHKKAASRTVEALQHLLEQSSAEDLEAVSSRIERALESPEVPEKHRELVTDLTGGREHGRQERSALEMATLARSFKRRRELLEGSLTASQVADLLGTTRQTPHDRVKVDTLLAILDRGAWRFPAWQFDPGGPDGVVEGLPEALQSLHASPLAKASWFMRPNVYLEGETPLEALRRGRIQAVRSAAATVGAS
ncbi:hypothetical protein GBA65_06970 [Rubrobacter marinus]|uniref:Antitoxin Xre/MbcA/ParS-like toxin-binding domain-containing protein n=1 Tax=Rubrobacter marinus TaxID=2653852 RepID=A0A6G8PVV2_9ACTN|nr:hypothetical protein [Rubrobacter marinus]QIN78297.1 hypothetical protein GBA65_06970 [Rubrobacter marinus]